MTYQELVEKAREVFNRADASVIEGHIAYQFNITGEAEGAFYLEISNGEVHVEPYEYYDRDVLFTTTADTLLKIAGGKTDPVWAYTTGRLKLEGSIEKALLLKKLAGTVEEEAEPAEEKAEAAPTAEEKKEEAVTSAAEEKAEAVTSAAEEKEEAETAVPAEEKAEATPTEEKVEAAPAAEGKKEETAAPTAAKKAPAGKKRSRGKKRR